MLELVVEARFEAKRVPWFASGYHGTEARNVPWFAVGYHGTF
jgi:hypothetical protein